MTALPADPRPKHGTRLAGERAICDHDCNAPTGKFISKRDAAISIGIATRRGKTTSART